MSMKLVCEIMINGVEQVKVLTTANNIDQGLFLKNKPGVGKPFYMFNTLQSGVIGADFDGAPIVSDNVADNNAAIAAMLAAPPIDKIIFS